MNSNNIIEDTDTEFFVLALSPTIMPTLETTTNIKEGDKQLSTIHHIVKLKKYTETTSNSLLEINELANKLPLSDISDTIERTISLLVSVHQKVVSKVTLIVKDLNCKCTQYILH